MPATPRVEHSSPNRQSLTRRRRNDAENREGPASRRGRRAGLPSASVPRAGLARPRLGNPAKSTATAGQDQNPESRREARYLARAWLSTIRTRKAQKRWADCGKRPVTESGEVGLKITGGGEGKNAAGFSGLSTCGSCWACPVCSAKIARKRTEEVETLLLWNAERGGSVALATFTMKHHSGHKLRELRRALSKAWKHITQSRAWKETRKAEGCDGYVRAVECTVGDNGWHLHAHVLLLFDGPVTQEFVDQWTDELYQLWIVGLAKSNMEASREHGVDVRLGTGALDGLGKYLSKLTYETAGQRFKKGKRGGRTPFQVLEDALETGLASDMSLWFEWETGSKGMQQLVWSDGLKARSGVKELKDEQIAEADDLDGGTVLMITPASWNFVFWHAAELLHEAETGGGPAAMAWLDRHKCVYETTIKYETLAE